jgi:hypothetical protein
MTQTEFNDAVAQLLEASLALPQDQQRWAMFQRREVVQHDDQRARG